jgi:hypothetical protein
LSAANTPITSSATSFCIGSAANAGASRPKYAAAAAATAANENTALAKHIQPTAKPTPRPNAELA